MATGVLPPPPVNEKPGSFVWLEWYRQLRNYVSTSGSVPWYIINFAGSKITDIAERLHNSLQGLQGGTSGEMYHLTAAQYSTIGSGNHNSLLNLQGGSTNQRYHLTNAQYTNVVNWDHQSLNNLQGGTTGEKYHLTSAQYTTIGNLGPLATKPAGFTGTVTIAKLTTVGTNGTLTFSDGILTAVTPAT